MTRAAHELFRYDATVIRVVDGDTVDLEVTLVKQTLDLGFHIHKQLHETMRERFRLLHINAPELSTQAGQDAKAFVEQLLPPGTQVVLRSRKGREKFGRWLGSICLASEPHGKTIEDRLVEACLAGRVNYDR